MGEAGETDGDRGHRLDDLGTGLVAASSAAAGPPDSSTDGVPVKNSEQPRRTSSDVAGCKMRACSAESSPLRRSQRAPPHAKKCLR